MTSLLALPFDAADLNGLTVVFNAAGFNAGADTTLTLSGLSGQYYTFTAAAHDLAKALTDKLTARETAVDAGNAQTWGYSYTALTLLGRLRLTRTSANAFNIKWGSSTFTPTWLGFAGGTDASVGGGANPQTLSADYQAGRLWVAPRRTWHGSMPRRFVLASESLSGRVVTRSVGARKNDWELRYARVPWARVFQFAANDTLLVQAVPGATAGDPNLALEALWGDLVDRTPLRYTPDHATLSTYQELQPRADALDWLEQLKAATQGETEGVVYYDLALPLMGYVS